MGHTICYFITFCTETTQHNENVSASPAAPLWMTKESPTLHKRSAALENTQQSAKAVFVLSFYCPSFQQSIVLFLRSCSWCRQFSSTGSPMTPISPKFCSWQKNTSQTLPTTSFSLPPSSNGWSTTPGSSCLKTWRFTPNSTLLQFGSCDASNPSYAMRRLRSLQTKQGSTPWSYATSFWKKGNTPLYYLTSRTITSLLSGLFFAWKKKRSSKKSPALICSIVSERFVRHTELVQCCTLGHWYSVQMLQYVWYCDVHSVSSTEEWVQLQFVYCGRHCVCHWGEGD